MYPLFTPPACPTAATPAGGSSATDSMEGARRTGTGDEDPRLSRSPGGGGGSSSRCCSGTGDDTGHPDIPPVLVVNFQLPDLPTPFTVQGDGPTLHIILTFHATRRLCRYAARVWAEERASGTAAATGTGGGEEGQAGSPGAAATAAAASFETTAVEPLASGAPAGDAAPGGGGDATANGGPVPPGRSSHGASPAAGGGAGLGEDDAEDVPESVRLLVEWMRRAQDDGNFRGRFKAIGDIVNMDEVCVFW